MREKVKLPREVAEAIEKFREFHKTGTEYDLEMIKNEKWVYTDTIYTYTQQSRENMSRYFQALVNGYEVEQTPEERVRGFYLQPDIFFADSNSYRKGIKDVLEAYSIKIEGVNDQ